MHEQQRKAGEKSGLVRAASGRLAHLLGADTDALLVDLSGGTIGGIPLDAATVQTIISNAASSALETAIRSNAAIREIELRHMQRMELEEIRYKNKAAVRDGNSTGLSDPDSMTVSQLMAREGTQTEAESTLSRPPADLTMGEWYKRLGQKQKYIVISWFDSEQDLNSACEMDARYFFDNMSR